MTNEEAIEELKRHQNEFAHDHGWANSTLDALQMAIEALQTQRTGKWIPVSESLPEDGQSVLFCDIDNDIMVGYHVKKRPNTHFTENGSLEDMKNVRAWMPLPEPYKEEGE